MDKICMDVDELPELDTEVAICGSVKQQEVGGGLCLMVAAGVAIYASWSQDGSRPAPDATIQAAQPRRGRLSRVGLARLRSIDQACATRQFPEPDTASIFAPCCACLGSLKG
jgi:hypothetical protein